jgi:plasmid stabilization system protein ParE
VSGTRELVIIKYPFLLVYRIVGRRVRIGRVLHQHQKYPA